MAATKDAEFLHELAQGLSQRNGITEDQAIQEIRDRYTLNSELHLKMPQHDSFQSMPQQPHTRSFQMAADLLTKGQEKSGSAMAAAELSLSTLQQRQLELEERRMEMEQKRYDAEDKRRQDESRERKDDLTIQRERLALEREQMRLDAQIHREEIKYEREAARAAMELEREAVRAERKLSQLAAEGKGSGSEEYLKVIQSQNAAQREYYKELNDIKNTEREHTDNLRFDFAKIAADRDLELAKLKEASDKKTSDAIEILVTKMDNDFSKIISSGSGDGDGEDFLDKYNKQIEKVNKFQTNLTKAGLKSLEAQGVDVGTLKKAHNITTDSEETTLDKIIGVGKDLYDKTIKPKIEESAKNESGGGTGAPSGLENAFNAPDPDLEARIRLEQEENDRINLEKQKQLERENEELINEYSQALYNKAQQYGITTQGLTMEELEKTIDQYELIMSTPFNTAPQTQSIVNLRCMANEFDINTSGKTIGQVDAEVAQAQQKIDNQLNSIPNYTPEKESTHEPEPGQSENEILDIQPTTSPATQITEPPENTPDNIPPAQTAKDNVVLETEGIQTVPEKDSVEEDNVSGIKQSITATQITEPPENTPDNIPPAQTAKDNVVLETEGIQTVPEKDSVEEDNVSGIKQSITATQITEPPENTPDNIPPAQTAKDNVVLETEGIQTVPEKDSVEEDNVSGIKRSITAKRISGTPDSDTVKNKPKKELRKFITGDGVEVESKSPSEAARKLANYLGGTKTSPVQVKIINDEGNIFEYDTYTDENIIRGKPTKVPISKRIFLPGRLKKK